MVFYPPDDRRRPIPPMYTQRVGPPNQMGRPTEDFFYPNDMRRPTENNFYPNPMRMQDEAYYYPNEMRRPVENYFYPEEMRRWEEAYFYPNEMRRQAEANFNSYQIRGKNAPPNPQPQASFFERLPDHLNTIMGHMGTVQNGVNMFRQLGSLISQFRR